MEQVLEVGVELQLSIATGLQGLAPGQAPFRLNLVGLGAGPTGVWSWAASSPLVGTEAS